MPLLVSPIDNSYFHSSYLQPQKSEVLLVSKALDELQDEIAFLDDRLSILKLVVDRLVSDRAALAKQRLKYQSLLAPIRRIPIEVLREIFSHTLSRIIPQNDPFAVHSGPWLLSHVCSSWRAITLAMPQLWDYAFVNLQQYRPREGRARLLSEYLARSGGRPLNLGYHSPSGSSDDAERILDLLTDQSNRWTGAALFLTQSDCLRLPSGPQSYLMLRELRYSSVDGSQRVVTAFKNAPALEYLKYDDNTALLVPWPQLKEVNLPHFGTHAMNGLARAAELTVLDIDLLLQPRSDWHGTLTLERLRELKIRAGSSHHVLKHLVLPNLRDLRIFGTHPSGLRRQPQPDIAAVSALIHRSPCTVQSLEFHHITVDSASFADLFRHVPKLHTLTITKPRRSPSGAGTAVVDLLEQLTSTPAQPLPLLPLLGKLDFYFPPRSCTAAHMASMLLSRQLQPQPGRDSSSSVTTPAEVRRLSYAEVTIGGPAARRELRERLAGAEREGFRLHIHAPFAGEDVDE